MNHNAINQRIQALESELAGLKAELVKPEKFEFNYQPNTSCFISVWQPYQEVTPTAANLDTFRYRQTKTNAEADFQLQKELMCIGALAEQIDPDYKTKVNWGIDKSFHSIQQDIVTKEYQIYSSYPNRRLGVVYMPKDIAEKICKILNNKEVEL